MRSASIRSATLSDIGSILANIQSVANERVYLATEIVGEDSRKPLEKLISSDEDSLVLVAEIQENDFSKIVGSLTLAKLNWKESAHVRFLGMQIQTGYRGMGTGSALMDAALKWAREHPSVEKGILGVFSSNEQAIRLYSKCGFQVEGIARKQFFNNCNYVDEVSMGLFVKP